MKILCTVIALLIILLPGCGNIKEGVSKDTTTNNQTKISKNNTVTISGDYIDESENNQSKIIFNGSNNEVLIEYFNAFFKSKNKKDVIIIEGNGNKVKIRNSGVVDSSTNSCDTLVIKGNFSYLELLQDYFLDTSNKSNSDQEIALNGRYTIISNNEKTFISDSIQTENRITNRWMDVKDVHAYYLNEVIAGNNQASFFLGELYQVGIGVQIDIEKSKYYYLIAARNGHLEAQLALGYLYENKFEGVDEDLEKAIHWYKLAAESGDEYAKERLIILTE